jgi:hypothetical protein
MIYTLVAKNGINGMVTFLLIEQRKAKQLSTVSNLSHYKKSERNVTPRLP